MVRAMRLVSAIGHREAARNAGGFDVVNVIAGDPDADQRDALRSRELDAELE